ncbi:hypothetical protein BJ508DRAFT_363627 [Ascobolus immersus RN42]|uniref:Uncharacterized protein n=1 Tax=Ascobolus immersus RN42 TaxID=1160509 RepID=A0A3N4HYI6_ASCIM|nr:hypothetical protein BJ508DRAFT_363627 [Ascobolus immersus RN42]
MSSTNTTSSTPRTSTVYVLKLRSRTDALSPTFESVQGIYDDKMCANDAANQLIQSMKARSSSLSDSDPNVDYYKSGRSSITPLPTTLNGKFTNGQIIRSESGSVEIRPWDSEGPSYLTSNSAEGNNYCFNTISSRSAGIPSSGDVGMDDDTEEDIGDADEPEKIESRFDGNGCISISVKPAYGEGELREAIVEIHEVISKDSFISQRAANSAFSF